MFVDDILSEEEANAIAATAAEEPREIAKAITVPPPEPIEPEPYTTPPVVIKDADDFSDVSLQIEKVLVYKDLLNKNWTSNNTQAAIEAEKEVRTFIANRLRSLLGMGGIPGIPFEQSVGNRQLYTAAVTSPPPKTDRKGPVKVGDRFFENGREYEIILRDGKPFPKDITKAAVSTTKPPMAMPSGLQFTAVTAAQAAAESKQFIENRGGVVVETVLKTAGS